MKALYAPKMVCRGTGAAAASPAQNAGGAVLQLAGSAPIFVPALVPFDAEQHVFWI